ncbi:MAG: hypothetical protein ACJ8AM_08425 [Gemmatimonadales bacterium]
MRAAVAVVLLLAACGRATHDYAITEQSQPFSDLNEAKAASAPPVVQQVTAQRIAAARNEPQNWLTYLAATTPNGSARSIRSTPETSRICASPGSFRAA